MPLTKLLSLEARNTQALAISSGAFCRCWGSTRRPRVTPASQFSPLALAVIRSARSNRRSLRGLESVKAQFTSCGFSSHTPDSLAVRIDGYRRLLFHRTAVRDGGLNGWEAIPLPVAGESASAGNHGGNEAREGESINCVHRTLSCMSHCCNQSIRLLAFDLLGRRLEVLNRERSRIGCIRLADKPTFSGYRSSQ